MRWRSASHRLRASVSLKHSGSGLRAPALVQRRCRRCIVSLRRWFGWRCLVLVTQPPSCAVRSWALTIRSSGPLRRVAVLSRGGQQRPLNSSVRGIAWNASSIQMCRRSASVSPAAKASAAHAQYQLIAASRAPTDVGPLLSRYPGSRSPQSTTLGFILFNASPSLFLRWCFSLQASISFPCTRVTPSRGLYWLLALYSHWSAPLHGLGSCAKGSAVQTPNYSFKRTAATVRAIIMRRSAAAA